MNKILKPELQIIIAAHDRPQETLRAIRALQKVDFAVPTKIIVSDNPTDTSLKVTGIPSDFEYKLREPCMDAESHFRLIRHELDPECEWTLITHDDDEMLPALGQFFATFSKVATVGVISGKSRIVDKELGESNHEGYNQRLFHAGLIPGTPELRSDLFNYLFDLGPLFPASAIIFRTRLLKIVPEWESTPNLAGDLLFSMHLAKNALVAFESKQPVMTYHIHGGNSVSTPTAAGGLQADFTNTRLQILMDYPDAINPSRKWMLTKSAVMARILAKAFGFTERYNSVNRLICEAKSKTGKKVVFWFASLPVILGPLKPYVRYLMWKRLGIKSFAKK